MNELSVLTNSVAKAAQNEVAKTLLKVCMSITPQFYKNKSVEELKAEKLSIELLTSGIEQEVLALMCRMAVKQYPLERARNNRSYFDINYLLTFYENAFNYFWCESVEIDKDCDYQGYDFNEYTKILSEYWKKGDEQIIIKYLVPQDTIDAHHRHGSYERYYSPKYYKNLAMDLDNIEF